MKEWYAKNMLMQTIQMLPDAVTEVYRIHCGNKQRNNKCMYLHSWCAAGDKRHNNVTSGTALSVNSLKVFEVGTLDDARRAEFGTSHALLSCYQALYRRCAGDCRRWRHSRLWSGGHDDVLAARSVAEAKVDVIVKSSRHKICQDSWRVDSTVLFEMKPVTQSQLFNASATTQHDVWWYLCSSSPYFLIFLHVRLYYVS